jgi:hypothetical protein
MRVGRGRRRETAGAVETGRTAKAGSETAGRSILGSDDSGTRRPEDAAAPASQEAQGGLEDQGLVYSTFVETELKVERDRRSSMESRGQSLITTSSTLVTLLAAVAAFVIRGDNFVLPYSARVVLLVVLLAFAAAAAAGIMANWLHPYVLADVLALKRMRTDQWADDAVDARSVVMNLNIVTIESLRDGNQRRVPWLIAGQVCQVLALVALTGVIVIVLS